ncbi:hypothetical protein OPQ81_001096 [Rhizoctonia solani]|nr:hypothetical protein OPQ81_001096 [Rhizoctonia solani]
MVGSKNAGSAGCIANYVPAQKAWKLFNHRTSLRLVAFNTSRFFFQPSDNSGLDHTIISLFERRRFAPKVFKQCPHHSESDYR